MRSVPSFCNVIRDPSTGLPSFVQCQWTVTAGSFSTPQGRSWGRPLTAIIWLGNGFVITVLTEGKNQKEVVSAGRNSTIWWYNVSTSIHILDKLYPRLSWGKLHCTDYQLFFHELLLNPLIRKHGKNGKNLMSNVSTLKNFSIKLCQKSMTWREVKKMARNKRNELMQRRRQKFSKEGT